MRCGLVSHEAVLRPIAAGLALLRLFAMKTLPPTPPRVALRIDEAAAAIGISRNSIYAMMKSGELPYSVVAGRRLIKVSDLEALLVRGAARSTSTAAPLRPEADRTGRQVSMVAVRPEIAPDKWCGEFTALAGEGAR